MDQKVLVVKDLVAGFGATEAVKGVSLEVPKHQLFTLIGPSGCGKSTFLRCLNRLHEENGNAFVEGDVFLNGQSIYSKKADIVDIRRQIGMVFQKPNPFPSMSIYENVAAGLRLAGIRNKSILNTAVEKSLISASLWDEVKDILHKPGTSLSGGQQQRLCIARALAVNPPLLLLDEPTSALDPISTAKIEALLISLKKEVTLVMVTHNMQQAARISDRTAFFLNGEMVEENETNIIFTRPAKEKTENYISGRFG